MAGASVETTLKLWASSLRDVKARMRPLFSQERVAASAGQFLDGLLGNEPRKTGWMRAEAAGDPGPWRQQAILGRGRWDADALRELVRDYALETLADEDAVLVIDETGFLKQGKASCGVARQYTGSAGKITNCQIGVFASYVSRHGHAFIDRALYLPKEWTDDRRPHEGGACAGRCGFATKPQIARQMIARAIAAKVPFSFVAADSVYGTGDIETMLRKAGKGYVLGVAANHVFRSWGKEQFVSGTAGTIAQSLPKTAGGACQRAKEPKGRGCTTGPISNWPISRPENTTAPSPGMDARPADPPQHRRWRSRLLLHLVPQRHALKKLVAVEGHRWAIEDSFETAKNELGLDHNETRSWHGWHRHVSLVMLAFAMMAAIRHRANAPPLKKTLPRRRSNVAPDPLVDPGNPSYHHQARATAHQTARIIAWSLWRRAHQAEARRAHLKKKNATVIQ